MKATLKRIASAADLDKAREIYLTSFPVDEQRPWELIAKSVNQDDKLSLEGIYLGDKLAGLLTTWDFGDFVYIEHFATDASLRNSGIGSQILNLLATRLGDKGLLLEAEPAEDSEFAARRIKFYERNGFSVIDKSYIQPPYVEGGNSMALWLLATKPLDPKSAAKLLHKYVYRTTE